MVLFRRKEGKVRIGKKDTMAVVNVCDFQSHAVVMSDANLDKTPRC